MTNPDSGDSRGDVPHGPSATGEDKLGKILEVVTELRSDYAALRNDMTDLKVAHNSLEEQGSLLRTLQQDIGELRAAQENRDREFFRLRVQQDALNAAQASRIHGGRGLASSPSFGGPAAMEPRPYIGTADGSIRPRRVR
jgi:hypothetical protein